LSTAILLTLLLNSSSSFYDVPLALIDCMSFSFDTLNLDYTGLLKLLRSIAFSLAVILFLMSYIL